jgi:arginyl-tRNA synthetase
MRREIEESIAVIYRQLGGDDQVILSRPDEQFGDFSTNIAMQLAAKLKKPPIKVAEGIVNQLEALPFIKEVNVAPPGFINLTLTDEALLKHTKRHSEKSKNSSVVIETNNPNPFKPMHVGHAYNAIVADTLANLLERKTTNLHRVSYHGDVGLHVGKSMWSILKWLDADIKKLERIDPSERNKFMALHYKKGSKAYADDEKAKKEIDLLAKESFNQKDSVFKQVYKTCFEWSFADMDENLTRLGNKQTEKHYLESQANDKGVAIVRKNVGKVFKESNGALVFHGEDYGSFTNVFVASNGQGLYGARDLGLIQLKNEDFKASKSYIVTGAEQRDYFKGVIAAAELCLPELKDVTVNIPTGTVKLSSGKMSSRTGDVLDIEWLFKQIEAAVGEHGSVAQEILVGAIRYEFLKVKIGQDVVFDVGASVSVKGNSGPYLQYSHARACSILDKVTTTSFKTSKLEQPERSLLRKLSEFSETAEIALNELRPHYVCTYLYELAQKFNNFYESNRVVGSDREQLRGALVKYYADTLKRGLEILGIPAPERM